MMELLRFFGEMALLRRAPQDLPGSVFLLQVLVVLNLGLGILLGLGQFSDPLQALAANLLELVFSAAVLYLGLVSVGKAARWVQSYSAFLGIGLLGGLLVLLFRVLAELSGVNALLDVSGLVLFFWLMVVMAHIVRHSFDMPLPFAILVVFLYTMVIISLTAYLFPPEMAVGES